MLILLVVSVILGGIVAGLTGVGFLFWVVSIFFFVCGLPVALITGFIHGEVEYAQDRADYREEMRMLAEEERDLERELLEEERFERYMDRIDSGKQDRITYNIDARSVHYHGHSKPRPRDSKGRFIPLKK